MVYCIVPEDLAGDLHGLLRRHFANDPAVEVVVEQRWRDRRRTGDRRSAADASAGEERRRIRAASGRRVADRRATTVAVDAAAALPRKVRPLADRLVFVERIEPSTQRREDIDTARLVARIQAGESERFSDLYLRFFDRVFAYLQVVLRSQHEAEDAAQHVFVTVLENIHRYERREQPFRAWMFRIARNWALRELERTKRLDLTDETLPYDRSDTVDEPELSIDWLSDREVVMFVERLPLAQRQVLVLRYMLDLSTADIAGILDRTPADVRMLHSRALQFLHLRLATLRQHAEGRSRRLRLSPRRSHNLVLRSRRFALVRW